MLLQGAGDGIESLKDNQPADIGQRAQVERQGRAEPVGGLGGEAHEAIFALVGVPERLAEVHVWGARQWGCG